MTATEESHLEPNAHVDLHFPSYFPFSIVHPPVANQRLMKTMWIEYAKFAISQNTTNLLADISLLSNEFAEFLIAKWFAEKHQTLNHIASLSASKHKSSERKMINGDHNSCCSKWWFSGLEFKKSHPTSLALLN